MHLCNSIRVPPSSCFRDRGCSVSCIVEGIKWCDRGLVRGWSEAERATLKWVKAIDRGPAQHHADSDLIAALQNLNAWESSRVQTAYFFASWRLWVSSGSTSRMIWWCDCPAYAGHCDYKRFREIAILLWDKACWLWRTYCRWFLLMWTYARPSSLFPLWSHLLIQTNTLTTEKLSGNKSIMGHVHCPCNSSAHWNAA